jgi:hypothetical protein
MLPVYTATSIVGCDVSHALYMNLFPFSVPRILGLGMAFFHL